MVRYGARLLSTSPGMFHVKQRGVELVSRTWSTAATFVLVIPFRGPHAKTTDHCAGIGDRKVPRHTRGSGARGQQEMLFDQRLRGMFCRNAEGGGRLCVLGPPGLAVVPVQGLEASRISVSLQRARTASVA